MTQDVDQDNLSQADPEFTLIPECGPRAFPYRDRNGAEPSYQCRVPTNVYYIYMAASGASGGYAANQDSGPESGAPGKGGNLEGWVPVIPGETLSIFVGNGAFHGRQSMSGYAPSGAGGTTPSGSASNGAGGGGSTAVIGSQSGMLIHAGGGGGAGGAGLSAGGGDGGDAARTPAHGTKGYDSNLGRGGRGGIGGDPKLTSRGGDGGSVDNDISSAGGGGGGGGGHRCGDGGGQGQTDAGGGGGGGGSSYIIPTAIGVKEPLPRSPQHGVVVFPSPSVVSTNVGSILFPNVFLRMDARNIGRNSPVGGVVNCQFSAGPFERFIAHVLANGAVAFESGEWPGVYLRLDGTGVTQHSDSGGGVVNCQLGLGDLTQFKIVAQAGGGAAIESVKFPNVFLRMDGRGVNRFSNDGAGIVNCQFGAEGWETFVLSAPAS